MKLSDKRLFEAIGIEVQSGDQEVLIAVDNMSSQWGTTEYPQLSMLLAHLRALAMLHQTNHWQSKGDPFYGDHLLFQRLYEETFAEVDDVAEKSIGLGSNVNVDLSLQTAQMLKIVQGYGPSSTIPSPSELPRRSLQAEMNFMTVLNNVIEMLHELGMMTNGLENLLQSIADVHERHVYLLKQRTT